MDYQIVLFILITFFGVASVVTYLVSLIINRNSKDDMPITMHAMGIFTAAAAGLSITFFIKRLLNENIDNVFYPQDFLFIIILGIYSWQTIIYLLSLISDWKGGVFPAYRHVAGLFAIIAAVLSLYFLFTQVPI